MSKLTEGHIATNHTTAQTFSRVGYEFFFNQTVVCITVGYTMISWLPLYNVMIFNMRVDLVTFD